MTRRDFWKFFAATPAAAAGALIAPKEAAAGLTVQGPVTLNGCTIVAKGDNPAVLITHRDKGPD